MHPIQKSGTPQAGRRSHRVRSLNADRWSILPGPRAVAAAVESTIRTVKRALIYDHMEHCIADAVGEGGMTSEQALREFK
jgi:hypothetical protein